MLVASAALAVDLPGARNLDQALAGGADIVIVGNSKVATDLDTATLSRDLGRSVAPLGVYGSKGPVWYAVLSEAVYAKGLLPKWVIAYGPLVNALPMGMSAVERARLADWMGPTPPALLSRWFDGWDTAIRSTWKGAHPPGRCEKDAPAMPQAPEVSPSVEESALVGLAELAHANGARFLFVRHPLAPSGSLEDVVPTELEAEARSRVGALGGGWLDLRSGLDDEGLYGDGVHMGVAGRTTTTAAFEAAFRPLMDRDPPPPPALVVPASPVLEGAAPALAFTSVGPCEATAPLPPALAGLDERLVAAGLGATTPLVVNLHARTLPHGARSSRCDAQWWAEAGAIHVSVRPGVEKNLTVTLPPDGRGASAGRAAWWILPGSTLVVPAADLAAYATAAGTLTIDGKTRPIRAGDLRIRSRDLVRGGRLTADVPVAVLAVGTQGAPRRELDLRPLAWSFVGELPAVTATRKGPGVRPEASRYTVSPFVPDEEAAFRATGVGRCSPLRGPETLLLTVAEGGLVAEDRGCAPLTLPTVPVALDPARGCDNESEARWLYPKDVATLSLPALTDAWKLDLAGGVVGPAEAALQVSVASGGRTLLDVSIPYASFSARLAPLALPALPDGGTLTLRSTSSAGWLLLTRVAATRTIDAARR